ncbi:hypothetical protein OF83DRAFT_452090 [Amylostereum chailletii]|nr:hypothetical protein OF83DRAFT_452090 [Amylostereum chailletii]
MAEVVNVIVAFAVIVFIFRWATSPNGDSSEEQVAARALRFKPKKVTPEMVDTVSGMFPDIPRPNIHYDLLRTGSTELTSNKILERGFLDAPPPAYFTIYPNTTAPPPAGNANARPAASNNSASTSKPRETLISRFNLESQVQAGTSGAVEPEAGGKAVWEDTAEKREASLRERKAQMILAARQMLAQQQKAT